METPDINKFYYDWAYYTNGYFLRAMLKKKIGGTALLNSREFYILKGAEGPSKIVFKHKLSGKFVDMGVGRGQKLGDVKGNKNLAKAIGLHGGRVAKKWYSTTITSQTKRLAELTAELYGKSVIAITNEVFPEQINLEM